MKNSTIYGIWYENRTTPLVVSASSRDRALEKGRKRKKQGYGKIIKVGLLNESDARKAKEGRWVRTRKDGLSSRQSSQKSRYRYWL